MPEIDKWWHVDGFEAVVKGIDESTKELDKAIIKFVRDTSAFVAERAVANAPILKGYLRAEIIPLEVKYEGDTIKGGVTVGGIPYAAWIHEAFYNLGPVSVKQPHTREGGVGRKYIERVVLYYQAQFQQQLANVVQAAAEGKDIKLDFS